MTTIFNQIINYLTFITNNRDNVSFLEQNPLVIEIYLILVVFEK